MTMHLVFLKCWRRQLNAAVLQICRFVDLSVFFLTVLNLQLRRRRLLQGLEGQV